MSSRIEIGMPFSRSVSQSVFSLVYSDRTGYPMYRTVRSPCHSVGSFMPGNPHFHARRRATLAIPIRHRDNLIAKEGRLYNTEPNLSQ